MKKLILAGAIGFCLCTSMIIANNGTLKTTSGSTNFKNATASKNAAEVSYWIDSLYNDMNLASSGLNKEVFYSACKGYEYLLSQNQIKKQGLITICDYSQSSSKKRLYVLDLNQEKLLFNTYVSHGRNSGNNYATSFSNNNESHKTCLGFMVTAETYIGEHGLSMRLDGMENGINDNVRMRSIVMHGSDYVNKERALNGTMMGRSFGCPAVSSAEVVKIVNCIKDGSCFFNYYPDRYYTQKSQILNANFIWPVTQSVQLASAKIPDSIISNPFPKLSVN